MTQLVAHSTEQLMAHAGAHSTKQAKAQPVAHSTEHLLARAAAHSTKQAKAQPVAQPVAHSTGPVMTQPIVRSKERAMTQSMMHSTEHATAPSVCLWLQMRRCSGADVGASHHDAAASPIHDGARADGGIRRARPNNCVTRPGRASQKSHTD
ncbi:hypothetical protein [Actinoplanes philippinensis]|uniref:hypothetical protein n=1 Tax=Actinoplanes philippinensis TaxID=35752 RepID=UPI0033D47EB8